MSYQVEPQFKNDGNVNILYDPDIVESPTADLFNPDFYKRQGVLEGTAGGRGASVIVRLPETTWVLRHYRRGGMVGKILNDQYFGFNRESGRSWSEWRLLHLLYNEGLPVPRPVAAAYIPSVGFYRAALITEFLDGTRTLAEILTEEELPADRWNFVGKCIARFHQRGVYHADLNAHNILLDNDENVFILDFDKGEIRSQGSWCNGNIKRLQRSLRKLLSQRSGFSYTPESWEALLQGYRGFSASL